MAPSAIVVLEVAVGQFCRCAPGGREGHRASEIEAPGGGCEMSVRLPC